MANILIFESGRSGYGGSFKCCHLIAKILKGSGHYPYVFSLYDSIYWEKLNKIGVDVKNLFTNSFYEKIEEISGRFNRKLPYVSISIDYFLYFNFIRNLKKFISEKEIALVHANTHFFSDFFVYKAVVSLKLPVICHLRSMPRRSLTLLEKKLAKYEHSLFIAISKAVLKEWVKAGIPGYKIRLVYDAQIRQKSTLDHNKYSLKNHSVVRLLYVGRLKKHKGINILVEALSIMKNKSWRLSIVGDGPEMKNLKKLVKRRRLSENINFYGFQESVEEFYESNDILIVPSIVEEFGLVIIEAMRSGTAVIGSDKGGIPEIIENNRDGILFESGNAGSLLCSMIEYLIKNPTRRRQIGSNGKRKVKNMFTEKYFTSKLVEIYNVILKS